MTIRTQIQAVNTHVIGKNPDDSPVTACQISAVEIPAAGQPAIARPLQVTINAPVSLDMVAGQVRNIVIGAAE